MSWKVAPFVTIDKNNFNSDLLSTDKSMDETSDQKVASYDIESTVIDKNISTTTLNDLISTDKSLVLFLNCVGYHYCGHYNYVFRVWQWILMLAGLIFLIASLFGTYLIMYFEPSNIVNTVSIILGNCVVPVLQFVSIAYGLYCSKKQLKQPLSKLVTSKLVDICKRDVFIFFALSLAIILICSIFSISFSKHKSVGIETTIICNVYNLIVACYLSVVMLFTTLPIIEVQVIQENLLKSVDESRVSCDEYMIEKERIVGLQNEAYYSTQLMTITAGFNLLTSILGFYIIYAFEYKNWKHIRDDDTYNPFVTVPLTVNLYCKEIIFFYYILFKIAKINSYNDELKLTLAKKCWTLRDKDEGYQYMIMYQDALNFPTVFKLGNLEVRRGKLLLTMLGSVVYFITAISDINSVKGDATSVLQ